MQFLRNHEIAIETLKKNEIHPFEICENFMRFLWQHFFHIFHDIF
jgi:hypothetical protein